MLQRHLMSSPKDERASCNRPGAVLVRPGLLMWTERVPMPDGRNRLVFRFDETSDGSDASARDGTPAATVEGACDKIH